LCDLAIALWTVEASLACFHVKPILRPNSCGTDHSDSMLVLCGYQVADPVVSFCETVVETSSLKCEPIEAFMDVAKTPGQIWLILIW
jgi:hypothetical protein